MQIQYSYGDDETKKLTKQDVITRQRCLKIDKNYGQDFDMCQVPIFDT